MDTGSHTEMTAGELRKFGLSTGAIFAVLFGGLIPWIWDLSYPVWPWIIFAVLGGLGLIVPTSLRIVHRVWMKFALMISKVTTPIILGIVFFLVIMPVGLVIRLFGGKLLELGFDSDSDTYRVKSEKKSVDSLEKPY